jgi:hypothetical protein
MGAKEEKDFRSQFSSSPAAIRVITLGVDPVEAQGWIGGSQREQKQKEYAGS